MLTTEYKKNYKVHVYETSPDGRLSATALFNYMQDIASDHALELGFGRDDLLKKNCFWVLSRLYVEINELPVWKEEIEATTWPAGTDKMFALRNYVVKHKNKIIANGVSSWLVVDIRSRRIVRPESILDKTRLSPPTLPNPVRMAGKLLEPGGVFTQSEMFTVKGSEIDLNMHTNSMNYLKWAIDTYPANFGESNNLVSVEINYLAESKSGDKIFIRTTEGKGAEQSYYHSVIRHDDNKELCRINIGWALKGNM